MFLYKFSRTLIAFGIQFCIGIRRPKSYLVTVPTSDASAFLDISLDIYKLQINILIYIQTKHKSLCW